MFFAGDSEKESAYKLTQSVGQIQFLVVAEVKVPVSLLAATWGP